MAGQLKKLFDENLNQDCTQELERDLGEFAKVNYINQDLINNCN